MILLDTHTLIWWVASADEMPAAVLRVIQKHQRTKDIVVSSMSFWEIALLYKKGKLQLGYDLQSWVDRVVSLPSLSIVPLSHAVLIKSVLLPEPFHSDPVDRILVSQAMDLGATLVTKDEKIRNYSRVESFWSE